jgi:hypothetical protein
MPKRAARSGEEVGINTESGFYSVGQQLTDAFTHLSPEDQELFQTEDAYMTDLRRNDDGTLTFTVENSAGTKMEVLVDESLVEPKRPRWRRLSRNDPKPSRVPSPVPNSPSKESMWDVFLGRL